MVTLQEAQQQLAEQLKQEYQMARSTNSTQLLNKLLKIRNGKWLAIRATGSYLNV